MTASTPTSHVGADQVRVYALSNRDNPRYTKVCRSPCAVKWRVGANGHRTKSFLAQHDVDLWRSELVHRQWRLANCSMRGAGFP